MIYKNTELHNVAELADTGDGKGKLLMRVPRDVNKKLNPGAQSAMSYASGCEIRFNINSGAAKITIEAIEDIPGIIEIFQGVYPVWWKNIEKGIVEIPASVLANISLLEKITEKDGLPFDARLTRILLPHYSPMVKLIDIEGDISPARKEQTPGVKYLAYGSSITHGASAVLPSGTYTKIIAGILGVDMFNLGVGGSAFYEKELADYIASRNDWDFATFEIGINMVSGFSCEEFEKRVNYFLRKISGAHPGKWIFCTDLFVFFSDYDPDFMPEAKNYAEFRKIVKRTVKEINAPRLVYTDSGEILENSNGLTCDAIHPASFGMQQIAFNWAKIIKKTTCSS